MDFMNLIYNRCALDFVGDHPEGCYLVRSYDERTSEIKTLYYDSGWKKAIAVFEEEAIKVLESSTDNNATYVDYDNFEGTIVLSRQLTIPYEDGEYNLVLGSVFGLEYVTPSITF